MSELRAPISRCAGVAGYAFALLALFAQSAVAATIAIDLANRSDTVEINGRTELNADPATAWRVLTDYERYVDFIPDLRGSRVVARKGMIVTVEETGNVMLWALRMPLSVTFEVTEMAPTSLTSHVVAGDLRDLKSRYVLTPVGNGVRLDYTGTLASRFAFFATVERLAVRQNVARRFQALADEIERQGAVGRSQS